MAKIPGARRPKKGKRRLVTVALTVWIYDSALGAAAGEVRLRELRQRNALHVHDAVTVTWMPGTHQPRIGHLRRETSAAAARGSVLGGLLELLFLPRAPGATTGTAPHELAPRLSGTGIDQVFLEEITRQLHAETSALVVLSSHADLDEVRPVIERGLARGDVVLMHALLPDDGADILRRTVRELRAGHQEG